MPPKKGGKGKDGGKDAKGKGKGKDEPPDVSVQMKKVKQEVAKVCADMGILPELECDKLFVAKFNETLLSQTQKFLFQGDRPDSKGIQAFTLVLKELCPAFVPTKTLCFWRSLLGDEGVASICEHLLSKKKSEKEPPYGGVVNLELFDCRLGPSMCTYLSHSLRENVPLKTLLLDHNNIGDQGVTLLAEGLRHNKELQLLSLQYCRIGPAGGILLGDEVVRHSNIKRLRLRGNRIMAAGLSSIARNLGKSTTLMELDVSDNSIMGERTCLHTLCESLRTNTSLEHVDLEHNIIGEEGAVLFFETLEMCPHIKVFKMSGTGIRDTALYKEVLKDGKGKKKGKKGKKKK